MFIKIYALEKTMLNYIFFVFLQIYIIDYKHNLTKIKHVWA